MKIYSVIMAGGVGERFWPESRRNLPKQFLKIVGSNTMIQETVQRMSPLIPLKRVLIVSNVNHVSLIKGQLPALKSSQVLLEPFGRNTAPCIGLAAAFLNKHDPDAVMVVLPSDHVIAESKKFLELIQKASEIANKEGALVTIGIKPVSAETGYGYIQTGAKYPDGKSGKFFHVRKFFEKPTLKKAQAFVKDGHYLWNSGMFVWKVSAILEAMKTYLPELFKELQMIDRHLGTSRQEKAILQMYKRVPKISIDYGVMENAQNVLVGLGDFVWDDVGAWSSLERHYKKDSHGNVVIGDHVNIGAKDSIVISRDGVVATLGVKDLMIIHLPDAVLVMDKKRAQEVKSLVEILKGHQKYQKYL